LIFDEASHLKKHLGDMNFLAKLYKAVSRLATAPRLILSGTGIDDATKFLSSDSNGDVRKYRMRSWQLAQVDVILKAHTPHSPETRDR